ncbi:MAG: hypothetical protein QGG40_15805, partial [Myxococcota bacterium]|nr:hypothetical protein [Myxococcota bacterium]
MSAPVFTVFLVTAVATLLADDPGPASTVVDDAESPSEEWDIEARHGPTHEVDLALTEGTWMSVDVHEGRLVFDLLGDLWTLPIEGGQAQALTSGPAWDSEPRFSPDGEHIAFVSDRGGNEEIWTMAVDGTGLHQLTDDPEARVTDPVWDPEGPYLLVRRRTVDTRSIGVTEIWQVHLDGGKGFSLTEKDAHPHAGETTASGRYLWFSSRNGRFSYDGDPIAGLWKIMRLDRDNGDLRPVVSGAGSAARPVIGPEGDRLAFVSRDQERTVLEILDVADGSRRVVADWLDHDQFEGFALHGVYPGLAWDGPEHLVLWAEGGLWRVGMDGSRTAIPFEAQGTWSFRTVERWASSVPDEVRARLLRWPTLSEDGRVAFSALGVLWIRKPDGRVDRLSEGTGYAPAWSPDGRSLAWTSWSDTEGGRLHVTRGRRTETLPVSGQLVQPAWDADGERLVVLRGVGGGVSPDLGSEAWFEIVLLTRKGRTWETSVVTGTDNRGSANRAPRLFLHDDRVWFMENRSVEGR